MHSNNAYLIAHHAHGELVCGVAGAVGNTTWQVWLFTKVLTQGSPIEVLFLLFLILCHAAQVERDKLAEKPGAVTHEDGVLSKG